jgi:hypothetical protein
MHVLAENTVHIFDVRREGLRALESCPLFRARTYFN